MKLGILNTSIITNDGEYALKTITLEDAKRLASKNETDSAIGHQSTADVMTTLLGIEVPMNRQLFSQEVGQDCLVFKLDGRPEEGKILTKEDIEVIGFSFKIMTRIA